ncbi:pirin family protein [Dyadobacter sediminis]|nr:hypothetical protein [Dyadobacter sediminis]GGC14404.1 hypothetical protein GCM10011325_46600 [Dyadobacter sediminis]
MLLQPEARIYLQSQRGVFQTADFYRFCTFNFDTYHAESRGPFGNLLALNDEMLLPQSSIEIKTAETVRIVLLPLAGALEIHSPEEVKYVNSGEMLEYLTGPDNSLTITNPYANETVNYLQIRFKETENAWSSAELTAFDISDKNRLLTINRKREDENRILIGRYDGREEGTFFYNSDKAIFVFVIEGAFEVQNRLLEQRDGLSLRNVTEIEFEALSNNAILLVMEV